MDHKSNSNINDIPCWSMGVLEVEVEVAVLLSLSLSSRGAPDDRLEMLSLKEDELAG